MSDPILAKIEKCMAAWEVFSASDQREPLPLYCPEHDKWQRQHKKSLAPGAMPGVRNAADNAAACDCAD
jgi:hypothetical protein